MGQGVENLPVDSVAASEKQAGQRTHPGIGQPCQSQPHLSKGKSVGIGLNLFYVKGDLNENDNGTNFAFKQYQKCHRMRFIGSNSSPTTNAWLKLAGQLRKFLKPTTRSPPDAEVNEEAQNKCRNALSAFFDPVGRNDPHSKTKVEVYNDANPDQVIQTSTCEEIVKQTLDALNPGESDPWKPMIEIWKGKVQHLNGAAVQDVYADTRSSNEVGRSNPINPIGNLYHSGSETIACISSADNSQDSLVFVSCTVTGEQALKSTVVCHTEFANFLPSKKDRLNTQVVAIKTRPRKREWSECSPESYKKLSAPASALNSGIALQAKDASQVNKHGLFDTFMEST
jgi:hypothetical protein